MTYEFGNKFSAIYCQAFIHLFPKPEVNEIFDKCFALLVEGGLMHFSTTIHSIPSDGYEEKMDYDCQVCRYRKRWTLVELNAFLVEHNLGVHLQYQIEDTYGKQWCNTVVSK